MADEPFTGHQSRECGEHRTTGMRAWCFNDTEWCSAAIPCRGCELPTLRAEHDALKAAATDALVVLTGDVTGNPVLPEVRKRVTDALDAALTPPSAPETRPVSVESPGNDGFRYEPADAPAHPEGDD